jgi:chitodextrinase
VPQGLTGTAQPGLKVILTWQASTSYVSGTTKYRVFRNGYAIGYKQAGLSYTDQLGAPGTYKYQVRAIDGSGVRGAKSPSVSVQVSADPPSAVDSDVTPPSKPTGLATQSLGNRRISLTWNASTDNLPGPIEYVIFRGTKRLARVGATSYVDRPTSTGTYKYRVKAIDAAGNKSYFTPRVAGVAIE